MQSKLLKRILQTLFIFVAIIYAMVLLHASLFKYVNPPLLFSPDRVYTRGLNLIPFAHSGMYFASFRRDIIINLLMYFPLGFLLSMKKTGSKKAFLWLLLPLGCSILMETLQYVLYLGTTDITDVLMNFLGAAVGFFVYAVFARIFKKKRDTLDCVLIFGMSAVAAVMLAAIVVGANWSAYRL